MKHQFVISVGRTSRLASLGRMASGMLLMAAITSASAQPPAPGAPGGQRQAPPPPPTAGAHLEIVDGSSASYRVTEQFVGINFPNDAMGTSSTVAGTLGIAADGSVVSGSKLSVDLRNLKSDQEQRDGYIKSRTFETDKYPMAEFVPTKITGLPAMIPFQGQAGFELVGNMTIHGVTKEVTFQGIATFGRDGTIAGRAKTSFNFETFGLTKPMIGRLMSVDDKIDLDHARRRSSAGTGKIQRCNLPMTKDDSGLWSVTTAPLQPELWAYTFSVDGVRTLDANKTR
jgi:polyisoprenoid-binding protein YceI